MYIYGRYRKIKSGISLFGPRCIFIDVWYKINVIISHAVQVPVLTATPHSYRKGYFESDLYNVKTRERIRTKFATVD